MGAVVSADAPGDLLVSGGSPGRTFLPGDPAMPHAAGQVATGRIQDGEGGPMAANGPNAGYGLALRFGYSKHLWARAATPTFFVPPSAIATSGVTLARYS
jgi:hypothetical protein